MKNLQDSLLVGKIINKVAARNSLHKRGKGLGSSPPPRHLMKRLIVSTFMAGEVYNERASVIKVMSKTVLRFISLLEEKGLN